MTEVRLRMPSRQAVAIEVVWNVASLTLACVVMFFVCGELTKPHYRHGEFCGGESRIDIAKMTTQKLANEAYPQWAMAHPDQSCPTIEALIDYDDRKSSRDPWGRLYELECRGNTWRPTLIVTSRGQDGLRGTFDDISSNL
jgi:hypothetical protein